MFQGKVRVRACGLLIEQNKILLLKHDGLGPDGHLWLPAGGGVEFGQSAEETVVREYLEETGLNIEIVKYLFANEHIDEKHHAVELFFLVKRLSGELRLGSDPELKEQILTDIHFFSDSDIRQLAKSNVHSIFTEATDLEHLVSLRGYFKFTNSDN